MAIFTQFAQRKYLFARLFDAKELTACCQAAIMFSEGLANIVVLNFHLTVEIFCSTATGRRSAPPLNLTGLPGTEKLNEREKEVKIWSGRWNKGQYALSRFSLVICLHIYVNNMALASLNDFPLSWFGSPFWTVVLGILSEVMEL